MGRCETTKGGLVPESNLSKTWALHTLPETTAVGYYHAFVDLRSMGRILPCENRFAQFSSDRD